MDLNHRPIDFQSIASTAELSGHGFFSSCSHRSRRGPKVPMAKGVPDCYTAKPSKSETIAKIPMGEVGIEIEL